LIQLQSQSLSTKGEKDTTNGYACIHFLLGNCTFGEDCRNVHSFEAPRPPCRFHLRGGCTNDQCLYSHGEDEPAETSISDSTMVTPKFGKHHLGAFGWYCQDSSSLLLLGKCGIERVLESLQLPPKMVLGGGLMELVHMHKNRYLVNRGITKIAWNFPASSNSSTDEENEKLLRGFFMSVSSFFETELQNTSSHLELGIALMGNQFSKLCALQSAQQAGLCLEWFEEFDTDILPRYKPRGLNGEPIQVGDATFYVFRKRRNVIYSRPSMMEIRQGCKYGIELEMTSAPHVSRDDIASALSHNNIQVINVDGSWAEAKKASHHWKLVGDASITCNVSQPFCNKFELVSPILHSEHGLVTTASILGRLSSRVGVTVNRSMGFHVHVDVSQYSVSDIVKICQQFIKYENVIDSMLPGSRRSGSPESNRYFNSNGQRAKEALDMEEEDVLTALRLCNNTHELADIMNPYINSLPDRRYYKLNLQNLVTGRQSTIEFRQHSATASFEKVEAWVRFVVRFCENSCSSELPTSFVNTSLSVDEQFDDLFKSIIRDSVLYSYYKERRHLLSVDDEGDACCHGCVTGRGCSK